jgi:hypothetical protein
LVRCIREKGIELSAEGKAALDALADDFNAWKADPAPRGTAVSVEACSPAKNIDADASGGVGATPVAPRTEIPLEPAKKGLPPPFNSGLRVGITMIERLGPDVALGTDGLQWIVYRAQAGGKRVEWQGRKWQPVGYIHSSKRALVACIAAKGLKLSAAGRAALKRQGDRIWRWRTDADGVRQTGACGQAEHSAVEIGIDAQDEGGRCPVPGLAANSEGRDMSPTQKLEAPV